MKNLSCQLVVTSNARHLQPILAGFNMLHRNKIISLQQRLPGEAYTYCGKNIPIDDVFVNLSLPVYLIN